MKTQTLLMKSLVLVLLVPVFSFFSLLFTNQLAYAEPPACFSDNGGIFREIDNCPAPGGDRTVVTYYNTAGDRIDGPVNDACYASTGSTGGTAQYRENSCANFRALVDNVKKDLCEVSGGVWTPEPVLSCACPAGQSVSPVSSQCTAPTTTTPSEPTGTTDDIERRYERVKDDCVTQAGEELDGDNCGIISIINTVFNLVSGAVSLAVIGNIIYAGIQYSMAQGDPGNVSKAKNRIRNALIAFIMYASLFGFLQWLIPGGVF